MLSFNLKELLLDTLIMGNIIGHQKISFDPDRDIEYAALEKSMQLFQNIPSLGKVREPVLDKTVVPIETPSLPGNASKQNVSSDTVGQSLSGVTLDQSPSGDTGRSPLIETNGKEVAYIESVDIKMGGENYANNLDHVEKIIEKYEESNYTPELFIRTFIESENEIVELENIEYIIQKKQLILQEWMNHKDKYFTDKVNKITQITKPLHDQIKLLEGEIAKYKNKEEKNEMKSAEKLLEKYTQKLNNYEIQLVSEKYAQKYNKISKKTYEELNQIIGAIRRKIDNMEQSESIVYAEKILDIVKKSKEDPDSLAMFINNNQSYIVKSVYNEEQLRELIPMIRKLVDDKKIDRSVLESLLLPMNKK
jgi:hypothetical protein